MYLSADVTGDLEAADSVLNMDQAMILRVGDERPAKPRRWKDVVEQILNTTGHVTVIRSFSLLPDESNTGSTQIIENSKLSTSVLKGTASLVSYSISKLPTVSPSTWAIVVFHTLTHRNHYARKSLPFPKAEPKT